MGPERDLPRNRSNAGRAEGVGGHTPDRHVDRLSGIESGVKGGAVVGFYANDADRALKSSGQSGHEPAAAHRDEDYIDRFRDLHEKFQADCALACAHLWLVVGVADERSGPLRVDQHGLMGIVVSLADLHHLSPQRLQLVHLEGRGGDRYKDSSRGSGLAGGKRERQTCVAARGDYYPGGTDLAALGCAQ